MKETKQTFVRGAFILIFANIAVKVIGALFKIPLTNIIGVRAMSDFNQAYSYYALFFMISTAGLPVAISRIIAAANARGNRREVEKIYYVAMRLFLIIGFVGSLILAIFSGVIANAVAVPELWQCILAISPTLFFICLTSACRGYFQGMQNMIPTAVSQTIEASGKLVIGLAAALWAKSRGWSDAQMAAAALAGITVGVILSFTYCLVTKRSVQRALGEIPPMKVRSSKSITKELIRIAIPITVSSSIMYLTTVIDSTMVISRLIGIGYDKEIAQKFFGSYTSMAVTLYNLPPNFVNPFAISLIPQISANIARGAVKATKRVMDSTLRICSTIIMPCAFGMGALSERILGLLFRNEELTVDAEGKLIGSVPLAGGLLKVLAVSIFLVSIIYVTSAMLQATGNERLSIISAGAGIFTKLISSYILLGIPRLGIYATPISTDLCYGVILIMNTFFLVKTTGYRPSVRRIFLKPLIAGVACAASAIFAAWLFDKFLPAKLGTILAILFAGAVYLAVLFIIKGVNRRDVSLLPKGEKLVALLDRFRLI
ncbi:MAG: polysaccharide biosynthesis protein [Clostridia bacterium]|nr:polysaccharide biosynthesis protein [Clostridia bacterium]